jgi:hypothetical protein
VVHVTAYLGSQHAIATLINHGLDIPLCSLSNRFHNHVDCMRVIVQKLGRNEFCDLSRLDVVRAALE